MKEEQKIYIRGSKDRPNDVRRILEQHGGKVDKVTNFTSNDCIYFINHDGIIDCAFADLELHQIITEYYNEVKLPSLERWEKGDILVNNDDDTCKFYVFDKFSEKGDVFIRLKIIISLENKLLKINDIPHLISYAPSHKANDKELRTFYNILAEKNLTWNAYNKELLHGNNTYFYPKNGHYYFRRCTLRCKDRATGEWYNAVLYSDANNQYVREVNDFNNKFKKVEI